MAENELISSMNQSQNDRIPSNVKPMQKTSVLPSMAVQNDSLNMVETLQEKNATGDGANRSKAKPTKRYERFGEIIRYLTMDEWQKLQDAMDDYRHKLIFRMMYHLGCRVGEFVRIQLKHLDFGRNSVLFPAENTKTGHRRSSHVPLGLLNEIKSMLKREGRMPKRTVAMLNPDDYLFRPSKRKGVRYSENRIRQVFQHYVQKAGLNREYGQDSKGRKLHQFTVHSVRHAHIMHHIHVYKLPLSIVQKQVGHRTLAATSVYLKPSDEAVGEAYGAILKSGAG